jgi:hypothetical protein
MGRKLKVGLVTAALVAIGASVLGGVALAERIQAGRLILDVEGGFKPRALPRHEFAPITLRGSGDISTVDGALPPAVDTVSIDWDRNGLLTTRGLAVCRPRKLEDTTTPAALRACRSALVGTGFASGMVAFPDDPPFAASSKVLAFNGPRKGGNPTLLVHAYAYVPAPTTFVVPVVISKIKRGRYGYHSFLKAPLIAGGYGVVTHFNLKIGRQFSHRGKRLSYVAARCPTGRLQANGSVTFVDGTSLSAHVFRPCRARK